MSNHQELKNIATRAYQRIFGDLDITGVDEYMADDFLQHNPTIADGREGVKKLVEMLIWQGIPKQKIDFKHVMVENDTVVLHSKYEMAGKEWRFIDIYRISDGKLAEHWDAMMPMPEQPANNNDMF